MIYCRNFIDIKSTEKYKYSIHPKKRSEWYFSSPIRYIEALKNKKGCVLLSPGCSSLDEYTNFLERGDDFAKIVNNLDIKC